MESSSEVVSLSVGGSVFVTMKSTLTGGGESAFFSALFASSFAAPVRDSEGRVFIDRDPEYFGYVLDFLRGGRRIKNVETLPKKILAALYDEAEFYGVKSMADELKRRIDALEELKTHKAGNVWLKDSDCGCYVGKQEKSLPAITFGDKHVVVSQSGFADLAAFIAAGSWKHEHRDARLMYAEFMAEHIDRGLFAQDGVQLTLTLPVHGSHNAGQKRIALGVILSPLDIMVMWDKDQGFIEYEFAPWSSKDADY